MNFRTRVRRLLALAAALSSLWIPAAAHAQQGPGIDALNDMKDQGSRATPAVENRFFLKANRFEVAPVLGYVPNNPFARRYVGGVNLAYHFTEEFAVGAQISYSPDLGEADLKQLTTVLIDRAHNAAATSNANFQQPLDKVTLAAVFAAEWAPVYGKINLLGETVLNFDFYGVGGVAMLSKTNYNAKYDVENANVETGDILFLDNKQNEVKVAPVVGVGMNFFLNQLIALKLDARVGLYVDNKPQYDPDEPVTQQGLYSNFITSAGVAFFFPRMKPRLYDF